MKNIKNKVTILLTLMLLVSCIFTGCGSQAVDMEMPSVENGAMEESFDSAGDILDYDSVEKGETEVQGSVSTNRKIIKTISISAETKEFDALIAKLDEELVRIGGYIERSSVSGNSYRYEGNRYAEFTVRVPSNQSDGFTTFVSDNSAVTSKEVFTEDVTLSYVDIESRISALQSEKKSLETLLEKAETLEDIIAIQNRLTDVIYEIESYESRLRTYDNLIDYTTISIYISEVERETVVEKQTIWEEILTNLENNIRDLGNGLVRTFVFVISNIPYIMVFVIIVVLITIIRKKRRAKVDKPSKKWFSRKKKEQDTADL